MLLSHNIVLPQDLAERLVDNNVVKEYAYVIALKSFFVGGSIHNYNKHLLSIADSIGCSKSTLRRKLNTLIELGWAEDQGGDFVLRSSSYIRDSFGEKLDVYRKQRFTSFSIRETVEIIKMTVISNSLASQKVKIIEKLKTEGGKYIKRTLDYASCREEYIRSLMSLEKDNPALLWSFNLDVSSSLEKLAAILNYKSKSSVSNLLNKLSYRGYVKVGKRAGCVLRTPSLGISASTFVENLESKKGFFANDKHSFVLKAINNSISFQNFELAERFNRKTTLLPGWSEKTSPRTRKWLNNHFNSMIAKHYVLKSKTISKQLLISCNGFLHSGSDERCLIKGGVDEKWYDKENAIKEVRKKTDSLLNFKSGDSFFHSA